MAEILCPVCNTLNPDTYPTCGRCGAVLPGAKPAPTLPDSANLLSNTDLLRDLRSFTDEFSKASDTQTGTSQSDGEELPDWLIRMRGSSESEPPAIAQPASNLPFELDTEEVPDWIRQLKETGQLPPNYVQKPSVDPIDEIFGPPQPEPTLPTAASGSSLDWLNGFNAEELNPEVFSTTTPQPASNQPAADPSEEIPDWLSRLSSGSTAQNADSGPAQTAFDQIDWGKPETAPANESFTPPVDAAQSENNWLNAFTTRVEGGQTPASGSLDWLNGPNSPQSPVEDIQPNLDWLNGPAAEQNAQTTSGTQAEETASGFLPDWLSQMAAQPEAGAASTPEPTHLETNNTPGQEQPAWLSGLSLSLPQEELPVTPAFSLGDTLTPNESAEPVSGPFSEHEIHSWLATETPQTAPPPTALDSGAVSISTEQLPSWLQSMRPIEAKMDGSAQQPAEKAGPLSGLRDLISPAEIAVSTYSNPNIPLSQIPLSENQISKTSILENLLADELAPKERPARRVRPQQIMLRWVVGLLLIVTILIPLLAGTQFLPLPVIFPTEIASFQSIVNALPENSNVLIAADYDAGLAGEMRLASTNILQHLQTRKARLSLISTSSNGTALTNMLLNNAGSWEKEQIIDLGYLPGGTASILELSTHLPQAIPYRYTLEGRQPITAVLPEVTKLTDYKAIILLTDNAESARAWVEQAQPQIGNTPLLIIASAQIAPLLRPYLDSKQVQGMVSGLLGGLAYEELNHQTGNVRGVWDAYQAGLIVAMIIVLIGAAFSGFTILLPRRKA
jgi:hypothetical protein